MTKKDIKIDGDFVDAVVGVHCFFNDMHKVALWFNTDNPMFGGCTPMTLVNSGRAKKVAQYVNAALYENRSIAPKRTK